MFRHDILYDIFLSYIFEKHRAISKGMLESYCICIYVIILADVCDFNKTNALLISTSMMEHNDPIYL